MTREKYRLPTNLELEARIDELEARIRDLEHRNDEEDDLALEQSER